MRSDVEVVHRGHEVTILTVPSLVAVFLPQSPAVVPVEVVVDAAAVVVVVVAVVAAVVVVVVAFEAVIEVGGSETVAIPES